MNHEFKFDVVVLGAGRIGLPWAVTLSKNNFEVLCIDKDEEIVEKIKNAEEPFHEPRMGEYLKESVNKGKLSATIDRAKIKQGKIVTIALNTGDDIKKYLEVIDGYAEHLTKYQIILNRTTLPIPLISKVKERIAEKLGINQEKLQYATFPERLAEGAAIEEIEHLPNIVGTDSWNVKEAVEWITSPLECENKYTDDKTAMFVKLIDNAYRDARFAISNQFSIIADEMSIDPHKAIKLANEGYPRNDIPSPGPVGGKCLSKDPHFLMDKNLYKGAQTSNLFYHTREVNTEYVDRIVKRILEHEPGTVGILGTAYKKDISDEDQSPSIKITNELNERGIKTLCFDPHSNQREGLEETLENSDLILLAVNHSWFKEKEDMIKEMAEGKKILDVWGFFELENNIERI